MGREAGHTDTRSWSTVLLQTVGAVSVLTLARPDKANALSNQLLSELGEAQVVAEADSRTRVVVLTGAGRHFCGGADLHDSSPRVPGLHLELDRLSKPVVAAVNGAAMGGGLELALACDFRLASDTARLGLPEITFGELPAGGGTARLARLVGPALAKRLVMTGETLSAVDAAAVGLVDGVSAPEDLMSDALRFAEQLAARPLYALRAAKLLVDRALDLDLASALVFERQVTATMASREEKELARREAAAGDPVYARIFARDAG